jgi:hypothetical protein
MLSHCSWVSPYLAHMIGPKDRIALDAPAGEAETSRFKISLDAVGHSHPV